MSRIDLRLSGVGAPVPGGRPNAEPGHGRASGAALISECRQIRQLGPCRVFGHFRDGRSMRRHSRGIRPANQSRNRVSVRRFQDGNRDDQTVSDLDPGFDNSVRIGYARVSTRAQDHQAQLDALAAAHCREVIVETASTRDARPKLAATLTMLQPGDTLVIYKPDRVARSMKELLVLLEDQLHGRGINLHILTGICAGLHRPDGATIADKMLFMVAAMAAEMERDLIRERTLDGLRAAQAQGRRGGRPCAVDEDVLAAARARRERGESVTAIARHLGIGRSTLYRALPPEPGGAQFAAAEQAGLRPGR
jgi:DNA invertase Pin-like site-specific DNA recombinase